MKRRVFLKASLGGFTFFSSYSAFSRPADEKPVFRFAVASDGHYGQPNTAYEKDFANLNKWLKAEKKSKGLDLIFLNGDLIHDDPVFLPKAKVSFDQLPVKYYVTRGNHDRVSADAWRQLWGYAPNHVVEMGGYAFVLADTSNEKGEYLCADADWLQMQLQKHADKKHVFVFMHIPPAKWTDNGVDCPQIRTIIEKTPNVAAVFHGHEHDQDDKWMNNGKPHFFDGHFGGNWGTVYKGYRIVEIFGDGSWKTYQCNPAASPIINAYQAKAKQY